MLHHPDDPTTPPGLLQGDPAPAQTGGRVRKSREVATGGPRTPRVLQGREPLPGLPAGSGATDRGPSATPRRSTARRRSPAREPIDFADWDGRDADAIDPWATLLQVAGCVMARYVLGCGMHRFEPPSHLTRAPGATVGWGGEVNPEPRREWLWVRIARRCLRRRANPIAFMDAAVSDFGDSAYPPPPAHYLDQIDARCPELRARQFGLIGIAFAGHLRSLHHEMILMTGRTTDYRVDELDMALCCHELSSQPLFQFCVAWRYEIAGRAARMAPRALVQYVSSKEAYDLAYGDLITAELRRAGEAFYDYLDREGD